MIALAIAILIGLSAATLTAAARKLAGERLLAVPLPFPLSLPFTLLCCNFCAAWWAAFFLTLSWWCGAGAPLTPLAVIWWGTVWTASTAIGWITLAVGGKL